MKKKKKIIIIVCAALIAAAAVILTVVLTLNHNNKGSENKDVSDSQTEVVTESETTRVFDENEFDIKYDDSDESNPVMEIVTGEDLTRPQISVKNPTREEQIGLVVNSWLKIDTLAEYNGRLCAIVENVSDKDVEYAQLSVMAGNKLLSFKITALLAGKKAVLFCNEDVKYNKNEYYVSWKIENMVLFSEKPQMHSDRFEITTDDGVIHIKNKKFRRIKEPFYICYKRKVDGMLVGSETRRVKVDSMKMKQSLDISAPNFRKSDCEIIFIDYGN